ncbi:MAG TPA: HAD-IIIA family hydrolase [Candidatus Acidoferrales bacterium]|nr:HAD-IIIA family hydrolase [Candidatus Acidoferrales bacterium]
MSSRAHAPAARVRRKARAIKLLILDVDGVLTDGGIVIGPNGDEIKRFDARDGQGMKLLQEAGIAVALVTGRFSRAVSRRARELGVRLVYQRVRNKVAAYEKLKAKINCADDQVAFAGDDIADLALLGKVGLAITVRDGWEELKSRVDYVTAHKGGRGAVREIAELLLEAQGKWKEVVAKMGG